MMREFKVDANVGKPQVAYRETITKAVEAEGKFIRQTGGRGQYGHVWLEILPGAKGTGYVFEPVVKGGSVPREYYKAIEKGIEEAMENGGLAGYPMVDVVVKLFDGSFPRSIPPRWLSRSPPRSDSKRDAKRRTRFSSSRSWRLRLWCPRNTFPT